MGSPKSRILSEIFLHKMEEKHFHNLKLNYNRSIISRYADDILIIYNNNTYIKEQTAQELNSIHKNIEFTFEIETNNTINYLGLTQKNNFKINNIQIEI